MAHSLMSWRLCSLVGLIFVNFFLIRNAFQKVCPSQLRCSNRTACRGIANHAWRKRFRGQGIALLCDFHSHSQRASHQCNGHPKNRGERASKSKTGKHGKPHSVAVSRVMWWILPEFAKAAKKFAPSSPGANPCKPHHLATPLSNNEGRTYWTIPVIGIRARVATGEVPLYAWTKTPAEVLPVRHCGMHAIAMMSSR